MDQPPLLLEGAVELDDPPKSLGGVRGRALGADPIGTSFSFPLSEPEVALAPPWLSVASVLWICMP
jgi:hypothetical protein